MSPRVISVKQVSAIGPNGTLGQAYQLTYMIGQHGPFTLNASQDEIRNGTANQKMQDFANQLAQLPLAVQQ